MSPTGPPDLPALPDPAAVPGEAVAWAILCALGLALLLTSGGAPPLGRPKPDLARALERRGAGRQQQGQPQGAEDRPRHGLTRHGRRVRQGGQARRAGRTHHRTSAGGPGAAPPPAAAAGPGAGRRRASAGSRATRSMTA